MVKKIAALAGAGAILLSVALPALATNVWIRGQGKVHSCNGGLCGSFWAKLSLPAPKPAVSISNHTGYTKVYTEAVAESSTGFNTQNVSAKNSNCVGNGKRWIRTGNSGSASTAVITRANQNYTEVPGCLLCHTKKSLRVRNKNGFTAVTSLGSVLSTTGYNQQNTSASHSGCVGNCGNRGIRTGTASNASVRVDTDVNRATFRVVNVSMQ